jgi:hypothetical protein
MSELPKMGDVYANADLVIAAAAAWDNSETFFTPQNPLIMSPCLVGVSGKVGRRYRFEGMYAFPSSQFTYDADREISYARLSSRAWCLQELKLAKRVIWFGQSQVQFICKGEGRIYSQGSMFLRYAKLRSGHFKNRLDLIRQRVQDASNLLTKQWWNLIEEYTSRWLTRDTDKLHAISGVAIYFQRERPNADYLAGLWNGPYLATGLLWYVEDRQRAGNQAYNKLAVPLSLTTTRNAETVAENLRMYCAPSWSWASASGIIRNNSYTGSGSPSTCRITITDVTHLPIPTTSQTPTAATAPRIRITIRGVLQRATWAALPPSEPAHYIGHRPTHDIELLKDLESLIPVTFDPSSGPKAFALMRTNTVGGQDQSQDQVGWFLPDSEGDMPTDLFCLGIRVEPKSEEQKRNFELPFVMRGIVLVPLPADVTSAQTMTTIQDGTEVEVFRRVGYFELKRREGELRYPDLAFSGPVSVRNATLPARWPYPDVDPEGFFSGCREELICVE